MSRQSIGRANGKWLIVGLAVVAVVLFFIFDLHRFVSLAELKNRQARFQSYYEAHALATMGIYMASYIVMAALSLPGAAVMTLAGGALFGLIKGTLLSVIASTIGATLAFLVSRYLFRDWVRQRFRAKMERINQGFEQEGGFYLFTLRMIPVFPFFVINLAMGLTPISTGMFAGVSLVGMLGGCMVYVNAGTQLARIDSLQGILSPGILAAFVCLGLFSMVASRVVGIIRFKRVMAPYTKPRRFDYNLVVLGAGSAGLVSAYIAAAVKAKVALVEKHRMGGDCLNTGCVPSKALLRTAHMIARTRQPEKYGLNRADVVFDFQKVMARVHEKIAAVAPHDSVDRYTDLGVACFSGEAVIESPYTVRVGDQVLTTRNIVVATGARPRVPDLPGLADVPYYTSDTIWRMTRLPGRLLVLGGGPIGCELAQAFAAFGSKVIQVQRGERIMKREDPDVSALIQERFSAQGIQVLTGHAARRVKVKDKERYLVCDTGQGEKRIGFDEILVALGRSPNVTGFGLEELGVTLSSSGTIDAGAFMETRIPTIFCAGDVAGPYQFTHTASHQSWYAAVNALFGRIKRFRVDYSTIPWATFTDPEVARVGLNETEAAEKQIPYEVTGYDISDLDRAIADSEAVGFVKVLTVPGKDRILGVTIVGHHAGDIISEFVLAMKHGLGLNKILGTIHIYPTMAEANKYAAGQWKKSHQPERILRWVKRYHRWMRGDRFF